MSSKTPNACDPSTFAEVLSRARTGDTGALDALTERTYPIVERMVHGQLARDLGSSQAWIKARFSTGDVVHEVFQSVLRELSAFAGTTEQSFVSYLGMVVRNRIIDAVRFHQAARRDGRMNRSLECRDAEALGGEDWADDPPKLAESDEQVQRLLHALDQLPERERTLVRARVEGLATFEQLAEQLGFSSESSARRSFYAAQARLAQSLAHEGHSQEGLTRE